MANSVSSLLFKAGKNIARPANYEFNISFPNNYSPLLNEGSNYDILCTSINIPTIKNEILEFKYKGHTIPIKGRSDYEKTLSATFMLDENQLLKKDFETWISALDATYINPSADAINMKLDAAKTPPFGSITVYGKGWNGASTMAYQFDGVFPTSVGSIEFNGETQSTVLNISIEFAFATMKSIKINAGGTSFLDEFVDKGISVIREGILAGLDSIGNKIEDTIFGKTETADGVETKDEKGVESFVADSQVIIPNIFSEFEKMFSVNKK